MCASAHAAAGPTRAPPAAGLPLTWTGYLRDWDRALRAANHPQTTRYNYLLDPRRRSERRSVSLRRLSASTTLCSLSPRNATEPENATTSACDAVVALSTASERCGYR